MHSRFRRDLRQRALPRQPHRRHLQPLPLPAFQSLVFESFTDRFRVRFVIQWFSRSAFHLELSTNFIAV